MRYFRTTLYILFIAIAAITLMGRPYLLQEIRANQLDPVWILVGPILFILLVILFLMGEIWNARRSGQAIKLSIPPLAFGVLLIISVLPGSMREYQTRRIPLESESFLSELLKSKDARVRALVMKASSCSAEISEEWIQVIAAGLADNDPLVRNAAKNAAAQRLSLDFTDGELGTLEAKKALENWQESIFMAKKNLP